MKVQLALFTMVILATCSNGMKPAPQIKERVQNVLDEDAANDLASLAKNTAGKPKDTKVPPGMHGMRKGVNGNGKQTPPPTSTPKPSTRPATMEAESEEGSGAVETVTPGMHGMEKRLNGQEKQTPSPKSKPTPPPTTPVPMEAETDEGSGEVETVVSVDEVRRLAAEIAALIEEMDMPLEGLKSELVDQVSVIGNAKDLSSFLKLAKEQFDLPMTQFGKMMRSAMNLVDRLYESGYETDGACLNLNKTVRTIIPESGEIPKNFHEKFLNAYLRSVSCVAQDNAQFHKDIAALKELNEGSTRDQVMAAISKVMVGSIRLKRKISEQYAAVRFVRKLLPKAGLLNKIVQYKRLI